MSVTAMFQHSDCPSPLAAVTFRRNTMLWLQYDSGTRSL
jgi:hypothetical protein